MTHILLNYAIAQYLFDQSLNFSFLKKKKASMESCDQTSWLVENL
jgi:hypothetical protein